MAEYIEVRVEANNGNFYNFHEEEDVQCVDVKHVGEHIAVALFNRKNEQVATFFNPIAVLTTKERKTRG